MFQSRLDSHPNRFRCGNARPILDFNTERNEGYFIGEGYFNQTQHLTHLLLAITNGTDIVPVRSQVGGTDSVPEWTVNQETMRLLRIFSTLFCGGTITSLIKIRTSVKNRCMKITAMITFHSSMHFHPSPSPHSNCHRTPHPLRLLALAVGENTELFSLR